MWALDNYEDIESDLSAFHRIVDAHLLPADRFISLAQRLIAYKGAVRMNAEIEAQKDEAPASHAPQRPSADQPRHVKATSAQLASDPGFGGMFEVIA